MPFKSRVEEEHDATIVISSGDESFEEFMDAIVSFYADRPTRNVIVDFFGKPPFRLTSEQVARLARLGERQDGSRFGGKTALVADRDCNFGIMRMFEALGKFSGLPFEVRVFRSVGQAWEWLRKPPARVQFSRGRLPAGRSK